MAVNRYRVAWDHLEHTIKTEHTSWVRNQLLTLMADCMRYAIEAQEDSESDNG